MSPQITIGIPSYQRPNDLRYLLATIKNQNSYPDEIIIADDNSPDQDKISEVIAEYRLFFESEGVGFVYVKNNVNQGYDKNLKIIINLAKTEFLMFIGNDDAVAQDCISEIKKFLIKNECKAYSRSFLRFKNKIEKPFGRSWFHNSNYVFSESNSTPNFYYRLGAYFGGLIFNTQWARSKDTDLFDGTLYYQIYLLGCAYYEGGIGYISYPIVGARIEGTPLFGSAKSEQTDHKPGDYTAHARSAMWASIMKISEYIDCLYTTDSRTFINHELKTRMSFHLFEMYRNRPRKDLLVMVKELRRMNLYWHPIPVLLSVAVLCFGKYSEFFFYIARKIYQR